MFKEHQGGLQEAGGETRALSTSQARVSLQALFRECAPTFLSAHSAATWTMGLSLGIGEQGAALCA